MNQTPGGAVLIVVLALAGLGMLVAFRGGARSGHRLARHSQEVTRMGGNLLRALGTADFIVAVQWAVVCVHLRRPRLGGGAGRTRAVRRCRDRPDVLRHRNHPPAHPQAGSPMTNHPPPREETPPEPSRSQRCSARRGPDAPDGASRADIRRRSRGRSAARYTAGGSPPVPELVGALPVRAGWRSQSRPALRQASQGHDRVGRCARR